MAAIVPGGKMPPSTAGREARRYVFRQALSRNWFRHSFWSCIGDTFAFAVVEVYELLGLGDVKNDVKSANRFFLRHLEGGFRRPEVFAFGYFFCPLTVAGEILQRFRVFNEDVHVLER